MNTIGFPIGHKEHEYRRAVLPTDLHLVKNADHLLFEQGYGEAVGFTDEDYLRAGAFVAPRCSAGSTRSRTGTSRTV